MKKENNLYNWCIENNKEHLIEEWNDERNLEEFGLTMYDVTYGSTKRAWWKCDEGHEWDTVISVRTNGSGCPYHSGSKALPGYNDLPTWCKNNNKEYLIDEWDYEKNMKEFGLTPEDVTNGSDKRVWWRNKLNHEWIMAVRTRARTGPASPYERGQLIMIGYNDLASNRPDIAKEWHPTKNGDLKPTEIYYSSSKKVWWLNEEGHEWKTKVSNRTSMNKGNSRKRVLNFHEWCIENNKKRLIKEWDVERNLEEFGVTMYDVKHNARKKVWWKNGKGDKWGLAVFERTLNGEGHPRENKNEIHVGYNDFATWCTENDNEHLIKEWNDERNLKEFGLTVHNVTHGSNKSVWWKSELGHEWKVSISSRTSNNSGCPYESNHKMLAGFNDFETWCSNNDKQYLLEEWHPTKNGNLKPSDVFKSSTVMVWWKNKLGHEWEARVQDRAAGSRNSPYENGRKILIGYNDLPTWCAENNKEYLVEEWHDERNLEEFGLTIFDITQGTDKKVWWKNNECGHGWMASVSSRTLGSKCPYCNNQTSFPEQYLYYALKEKFKNVKNRKKINGLEYDIYIKDINLLIEYDGYYYHRVLADRSEKEKEKRKNASRLGYKFIRIVESVENKNNKHIDRNVIIHFSDNKNESIKNVFKLLIDKINNDFGLNLNAHLAPNIKSKAIKASRSKYINKSDNISITHPEIIKGWHPTKNGDLIPEYFSRGSLKSVYWICEHGHTFKRYIPSQIKINNCPICKEENSSLLYKRPDIAAMWHPTLNLDLKPSDVKKYSDDLVRWKCNEGHIFKKQVRTMVYNSNCPVCRKIKREAKKKDSIIPISQPSHQQQIHLN